MFYYIVKELQVPIYKNGELVYKDPTLEEKRKYCEEQMATLYPEIKRNENPHQYYVDLTEKLRNLKQELILQNVEETNKVKIKKMGEN